MPWSGGNYTKWNGAGGWTADAAANIGIEAGRHDDQDVDFQNGIDACLNKNGQNSMTNDLNLGGNKITNVDNAAVSTDAVTLGQVQAGVDIQSTSPFWTVTRFSNDVNGGVVGIRKSRGATVGTNTIVQNGDVLGAVQFYGANGTSYDAGADIVSFVDGTPGATNDMPGNLVFRTTPDASATQLERLRIGANGFIGINEGTPDARLDVQGVSTTKATISCRSEVAGDVANAAFVISKFDNNSTVSQLFARFYINNVATGSGQINANGASQAAFGTFSDERLKDNITDLPSQSAALMALRPVEFDYKDGSGHQIGFIAQEVINVYPDLVGQDSNGYYTLTGMGKNEARLVKGFQELVNRIIELEARVAALEA